MDVLAHPHPAKYPRQQVLVVGFDRYVYLVSYVEDEDYYLLKTIIPSRQATRDYLGRTTTMTAPDQEETELLQAFEQGMLASVASKDALAKLKAAARATAVKDKRVNIRLSSGDLSDIQVRALQEGVPYQTLIASILHKYVTGRLAEQG